MTRILHYFEPSTHGVPNFVAFLAEHQTNSGHHAAVLGPNPRRLPNVVWTNDEIQRSSPRSILQSGRRAARLATRIGADVIHAHSFFAGMAIRLINPDQPVVYTPHAWAFSMSGPTRYGAIAIERALLGRTARVLCVSEGAAEAGRDTLGPTTPIVSIGSAIDLDRFSTTDSTTPTAPHALETSSSNAMVDQYTPFAVCVGRISHQKGQLALAERWAKEMPNHPLQLVFVGDGHPDIDIVDGIDYPLSTGNVHFVGPSTEVPAWLRASAFAVQPSRWEAMSLATVEALACGRPVIATDVAGMREAIVDGPLAPAGAVVDSIDHIAPEARSIFENSAQLSSYSAIARRRSEVLYSPDRLVARTETEYGLALGRVEVVDESNVVELRPTDATPISSSARDASSDESPEVAA